MALWYGAGVRALWRASAPGRGLRRWEVVAFAAGWLALALALVSPLHPLGEALFSAHMAQHELLMVGAAPLLVLGRPLVPFIWALPRRWRRASGEVTRRSAFRRAWGWLTRPSTALLLHAAAIWIWHAPRLYDATLDSLLVHTVQHVSFLSTALLFWWSVLGNTPSSRGTSVTYLFATMLHTGALGVVLAFSDALWYPAYATTTIRWGLTPLEDQQLGGLIMWIPGSISYLIAGLALFAKWMRESESRVLLREKALAVRALVLMAVVGCSLLAGCDRHDDALPLIAGGDARRGKAAIRQYGCGTCHTIPGVSGANGLVGPPLASVASRVYVGGVLTNTPEHMIGWIENPKSFSPRTAMPSLGVTHADAVNIASYLYTLK
jgi:cytochrome c oxidase assembly factor CtaG/cytochrome c2